MAKRTRSTDLECPPHPAREEPDNPKYHRCVKKSNTVVGMVAKEDNAISTQASKFEDPVETRGASVHCLKAEIICHKLLQEIVVAMAVRARGVHVPIAMSAGRCRMSCLHILAD